MITEEEVNWPDEPRRDAKEDEYPISASATKTFKRCPENFRLRYLTDHESTSGGSDYADLGSAVHEVLEETLQDHPELDDKPNQLKEVLLGKYREYDFDFDDSNEDLEDTGLSCLNVAARYIASREINEIRGIEQEFTFGLKRADINHSFKGIMDVATGREIWDWKTGKNADETDEIIQGMIYAMGYYDEFGEVPQKIRFVYLQKETERALDPDDENWQKMLDHVRNVVDAKQAGEFEANPGGSRCFWCGYEGFCSASPVGAGGISWQNF